MKKPVFYDYYKDLRFDNITSPRYRHIFMLAYWPLFGGHYGSTPAQQLFPVLSGALPC